MSGHGDHDFLAGGGDMGLRIRAFDWQANDLGAPENWPLGLKTAVRVMLTTHHPIFIFWGRQHICLYNDAYSRSLGDEKHPSILGAPGRECWPEIWAIIGPQIEYVMAGKGATWHENQLVPIIRHGELRDVYWTYSYSPIHAPESPSGVGGVLVICTETTQQVLAERRHDEERRALALNRARLDYATRLSGVGFWYCDLPFDVLEWDERVKEHFFLPPTAQVTIEDFYARIHEDDREITRAAIQRSIATRTPYDIVYRTVDPGTGACKWIRALGGTDYASDGTPTHFDGVTVDVSAQKRDQQNLSLLNRRLREQDRRKDEFIATLSHELRNPLSPIRAAAKVIASKSAGPAQLQRSHVIIDRQVTHMSMLLDDLLDIARITQGKLHLKKRMTSLASVVDTAVEAVRPALLTRNHELNLELPSDPLHLYVDPVRLSQILSNLLTNAAKYSDPGGRIRMSARVQDQVVSLTVQDDGIGIAPDMIDGVFDMFSQVDEAAGRSDGGLGIGLALVKGLTELHGGSVQARSDGPGRGSEFVVRLPLLLAPASDSVAISADKPARASRRRILIADDNQDAADSISMLLELAGHDVRAAYRGRAALSLARIFQPHIVLLDIGMPDMSGYELAESLRREPWAAELRQIALTGWGQDGDRRKAFQAGFHHHLTKPVDPERLLELIHA